ncbi:carbon storage regulator [Bythopirellula goksoeyrii]|uniref:Translational regulator CsrA n=1 Tax=Bythopirellula goksoeyrii TaxID=1400387 RepID=A0A5B9Q6B4_9BACT|nr:carbon storage regulator [Bythopirellula goksoeyrii]QEG32952.1 hypothetical protein Pr1d_02130 [Bythopirellula goksoeyrii]
MLVLTRKQNEKIKIGNDITITVLRMKGKGVRLGIQAPEDMNVLRGELVFDIEDDSLEQEVRQNDSVLEPKTVPTGGSSGNMTSNRFCPSSTWSSESSQTAERTLSKTQSGNCQVSWSI